MRRRLRRGAGSLAFPVAGFVLALALFPSRWELVVHVFVLVVLGIGLLWFVAAVHEATTPKTPSAFDDALTRGVAEPERLVELVRLERGIQVGAAGAFDLHYRLLPVLRETARGLLAVRRGIDLDRQPDRARAVLGDETWELLRPDREPPEDRLAPGPGIEPIARAVTALETI